MWLPPHAHGSNRWWSHLFPCPRHAGSHLTCSYAHGSVRWLCHLLHSCPQQRQAATSPALLLPTAAAGNRGERRSVGHGQKQDGHSGSLSERTGPCGPRVEQSPLLPPSQRMCTEIPAQTGRFGQNSLMTKHTVQTTGGQSCNCRVCKGRGKPEGHGLLPCLSAVPVSPSIQQPRMAEQVVSFGPGGQASLGTQEDTGDFSLRASSTGAADMHSNQS